MNIIKDIVLNKIWIKLNRVYRKIIDSFCFLQVLNKKKSLNLDWANEKAMKFEMKKLNYHFTNNFESKIDQNQIWFIANMMNKFQKNVVVLNVVHRHNRWRFQVHIVYKKEVKQYILTRRRWKYHLIQKTQNMNEIEWSTNTSMNEIFVMTNSRHEERFDDYKSLLKKEIVKTKNESKNNDIILFE